MEVIITFDRILTDKFVYQMWLLALHCKIPTNPTVLPKLATQSLIGRLKPFLGLFRHVGAKLKGRHDRLQWVGRVGWVGMWDLVQGKVGQPWLHKLSYGIILQSILFMSQFNYYVLPTPSFSSFYYLSLPSANNLDPPPDTHTQIPSQSNLRGTLPQRVSLELTREQLLAAGYQKKKNVWSAEQDERLLQLIGQRGVAWKDIHLHMGGRTEKMCYSRHRRLMAEARHRWAPEEERRLIQLVQERGQEWKSFLEHFPSRTWKQIRDKYVNYLRPGINKEEWTVSEDMKILELLQKYGTKWKLIQREMAHRTDNQIKNRYYGRLKLLLKRKARSRTRL